MNSGAGSKETLEIITSAYTEIPGLNELGTLALAVIGAGLIISETYQLYKLMRGAEADFLAPALKAVGAGILIALLLPLVGWISTTMYQMSNLVFEENLIGAADRAINTAFRGVTDPGLLDYVKNIFSPMAWLGIVMFFSIGAMLVVKMAMIDAAWPVMLGLVVLGGMVSIPIGLFPGMNTIKGWVTNVIEVSIWPLVFQITTTILFAVVHVQLAEVEKLEGAWEKIDRIEELEFAKVTSMPMAIDFNSKEDYDKAIQREREKLLKENGVTTDMVDGIMFTFLKFLAINLVFLLLCLFTPYISRVIVRSDSAGAMGTMIVGGATMMAAMAVTKLKLRSPR